MKTTYDFSNSTTLGDRVLPYLLNYCNDLFSHAMEIIDCQKCVQLPAINWRGRKRKKTFLREAKEILSSQAYSMITTTKIHSNLDSVLTEYQ